jgi:hypothetical protein
MKESAKNKFTKDQWIALVAGVLATTIQGSLYVFGSIMPYISSYLYYEGTSLFIQEIRISKSMTFNLYLHLQF